ALRLVTLPLDGNPLAGLEADDSVVLDEHKRRLIVTVDDAEVVVEARGVRSRHKGCIPVDGLLTLRAQVPLANAAGRVTGAFEQAGNGRLALAELVRLA